MVSGWGQTSFTNNDAPTSPQKQVYVSIVNYATCRASFANTNLLGTNVDTYLDPNGEICAGGQSMRDACSVSGNTISMSKSILIYPSEFKKLYLFTARRRIPISVPQFNRAIQPGGPSNLG